jgi:hypothetical protein
VTGPGVAGVLRPAGRVAVEVRAGVEFDASEDGSAAADACPADPEIKSEICDCNWLISLWPADAAWPGVCTASGFTAGLDWFAEPSSNPPPVRSNWLK